MFSRLADYYCALPILTHSLDHVILKDASFIKGVEGIVLLPLAFKLRNSMLFRDALILAMSPWSSPSYTQLDDQRLKDIAFKAHLELSKKVNSSQTLLFQRIATGECTTDIGALGKECIGANGALILPKFLRSVHRETWHVSLGDFSGLMSNKLKFNQAGTWGFGEFPGVGIYEDSFLCIEIADEDLPWDKDEVDW